jgi:regulator of sigma E protease
LINTILDLVGTRYPFIITILAFVVVLGITITVHEFGHFAMAKLLKIKVLVFSLGFGPRLAGFTRGGTEYRLSPFPLGGYVKMAGETFDEERKGEPDEFLSHPKWHRFLVAVAGPSMNILLAIAIGAYSIYVDGVEDPKYLKEPAVVGPVSAGSPARLAGLRSGDRIVSVHGNTINTWYDLEIAIGTAPRNGLDVEVVRDNQTVSLHINPPSSGDQIDQAVLGFKPFLPRTVVYGVDANSPAQKAGLREGDQILSVKGNGQIGTDYSQILNIISESKGIPLDFEVRRPLVEPSKDKIAEAADSTDSKIVHFTITPVEEGGRVVLGFFPYYPSDVQKFGVAGAIGKSVGRTYEMSALTFRIVGRLFRGSASVRTLSGPIEIARMSGSAARTGIRTRSARLFFVFLGLISLNLGIFNLLPIPILDGGVIALLLIEGVIRRDLSLNIKEKIVQVGFVFLILLMGFVVFNDLSKIIDFNRLFR